MARRRSYSSRGNHSNPTRDIMNLGMTAIKVGAATSIASAAISKFKTG